MSKNNNKKGFTLVELIATIAIIAVILLLSTLTYTGIKKKITNKQYDNLKTILEADAVKYASKSGDKVIFVDTLVTTGITDPDKPNGDIYDPRTGEPLNCYIIAITEDEKGNLKAELLEGDHRKNGTCDASDLDVFAGNLSLSAKLAGTTKDYSAASNEIYYLNSGDKYPAIYKGWTNQQLDLTANINNIKENKAESKFIWNKNTDVITNYPTNTHTTSETTYYNAKYYVNYLLSSGSNYEASIVYKYDNEKPVIYKDKLRLGTGQEDSKWRKSKTIYIYATDKDGVGIKRIYVGTRPCTDLLTDNTMGQAGVPGNIQTYTYTGSLDATGITVNVCAIDYLGNLADGSSIHLARIDNTAPTCTITGSGTEGENGWFKSNITVSMTKSDDGGAAGTNSGLKHFGFGRESEENYNNFQHTYSIAKDTSESGEAFYGFVEDNAGNKGTCNFAAKKDSTPPTCSITTNKSADGDSGWYKTKPTITLTTTDTGSGLNGKGITTSNSANYNNTASLTASDSNSVTYYGWAKDKAGNTNSCNTGGLKIDSTAPTCTISKSIASPNGSNGWYKTQPTLTLNMTENGSGISQKGMLQSSTPNYNGDTSFTAGNTGSSGTTYYGYVKDAAGNTGSCNTGVIKIDNAAPTCSFEVTSGTKGNGNWYTSNVDFKINRNDSNSGIANSTITTSATNSPTYNNLSTWTISNDTDSSGRGYYGYVIDNAGNTGSCSTTYYKDATPPVCTPTTKHNLNGSGRPEGAGWSVYFTDASHFNLTTTLRTNDTYTPGSVTTYIHATNTFVDFYANCSDGQSGLNNIHFNSGDNNIMNTVTSNFANAKYTLSVSAEHALMTGFGAQATDAAGNTSPLTPSGCTSTNMGSCSWNDHVITIDRTKPNTVLYVYKLNSDGSKGDLISGPIYNNGYDNLNTVNHKYYFEIYRYDTGFSQIAYSNGFGFRTSIGGVYDSWNVPDDPNYNKWYTGSKIDETLEAPGNRIAYVTALNNLEGKRELRIRVSISDSAPAVQDVDHTSGNNSSTIGNKCSNGPDCGNIHSGHESTSICGSKGFMYATTSKCFVSAHGAKCPDSGWGGAMYYGNDQSGCHTSSEYKPFNLANWQKYGGKDASKTKAYCQKNSQHGDLGDWYAYHSDCVRYPSELEWITENPHVVGVNFTIQGSFWCCK